MTREPRPRSLFLRDRIRHLHGQGMNFRQIGDVLCLCPQAIGYHAHAIGIKGRPGNPQFGPGYHKRRAEAAKPVRRRPSAQTRAREAESALREIAALWPDTDAGAIAAEALHSTEAEEA